ncbi:MAG: DUF3179 domain-containing protein [Candidatus Hydrogenedentes bacterium]|nr:DUF3179 domain-containing protein [Candidatus Hydrogenedentota bacterium]
MKYLFAITLLLLVVALAANWSLIGVAVTGQEAEAAGMDSTSKITGLNSFLGQFDTKNLAIPQAEIRRGGPAKDGIPAITDPRVTNAGNVHFLGPADRVAGVAVDGEARAYPIRLLNWHEVINDRLGSVPLAVIYCPLCDSVSVVDRRIDNETLEFGVSGLLLDSNVLLYDRTDNALWSQVGFEAISGPHAGHSLRHLPFDLTTFEQWNTKHPNSTVVTFETGHRRNYRENPYGRYFDSDDLMFPAKGADDRRLPRKEPVVGIQVGGAERAYPVRQVADAPDGRIEELVGDGRVIIEALDDGRYVRVVEVPDSALVVHTFWFAWISFHPQTTVFELKPK